MAWTAPKTWSTNEILTSPDMNTYVRDNPAWLGTDKPHCRVTRTTTQAIPDTTETPVSFNAESYDTGPMHDVGTNASRVTCPVGGAGVYSIKAGGNMAAGGYTRVIYALRVNGTTQIDTTLGTPPSGTGANASLSTDYYLAEGDYVELTISINGGASVLLNTARMAVMWQATS